MNSSEVIDSLSHNEKKLLLTLKQMNGIVTPTDITKNGIFSSETEVMGAASWLNIKKLVDIDENQSIFYTLADRSVAKNGLPERRAIEAIGMAGGTMNIIDLSAALPNGEDQIAVGFLKKKGFINIEKKDSKKILTLTDAGYKALHEKTRDEIFIDKLSLHPVPATDVDKSVVLSLKNRHKIIRENVKIERIIKLTSKGREVLGSGIELGEEVVQITDNIIQSGKWRNTEFKKYDVHTFAPSFYPSKKHLLSRLGAEIRELYTSMGFTEIDGEFVEPAFWDLDVLYVPQDHPARELQDTFYLSNPKKFDLSDYEKLVDTVKNIHENGGETGSTGWGGKWSREMAEQAMLRTHTTVNTISYISRHPEAPAKVFSLSRIFRRESIDATHLPEFTQIEGIVIDENSNFDMLVSLVKEFYAKMGFDKVRIRPAYFPYTEPSLELEIFFNGKWMELGGAGIFRPEVVSPFGVKYPVLAWGFGFERLAMLRWGITDIRDLYISDIDVIRKSPTL
ncbi:MAG: phenylalanine--tRNA ligase subunit alpha [archaeon]|nr:phenylalanine--tRNA ligase subunit alpha [archaeon]